MPTSPAPTFDQGSAAWQSHAVDRIGLRPSVGRAGSLRGFGRAPAPSLTRLRSAGFTLIELMVVITIIALASAAVVLTLPDGSEKLRADAERFAGRVAAARDNAIVQARPMAVWVSPSGYGFARREQGAWRALEDKPFATTNWRDGVVADTGGQQVRVTFDGTGMTAEPVAVTLVRDGRRAAVTVDPDGRVTIGG